MDAPRWMVDEMLGRLARYLRFLGHDTEYARGLDDGEIVRRTAAEGRVLLTRDRALARRTPSSLLLISPAIDEQLRAVRRAFPSAPYALAFDRCSECNGKLERNSSADRVTSAVGRSRSPGAPAQVWTCATCGHAYWDGSHTSAIRARFQRIFASP